MATPRFSPKTLKFIQKASRQKSLTWLERNRAEYEAVLVEPLLNLAQHLKAELGRLAPGYHFPQKGLGRLKRSANRIAEYGSVYKDWISYAAALPRKSRFDHNPNLFFMIYPDDEDGDTVLVAGGLYMPSSRQLRAIREAIATDARPFDRLFDSKAFAECFKGGFSDERKSKRPPRGFDIDHPRMDWLKLQAYFVWRPYSKKEFHSPKFPEIVARDFRQILRLNALLEQILAGRWTRTSPVKTKSGRPGRPDQDEQKVDLSTRLEFEAIRRPLDF